MTKACLISLMIIQFFFSLFPIEMFKVGELYFFNLNLIIITIVGNL